MKKVFNSAFGRFMVLGLFAMMGISSAMIAQTPVSASPTEVPGDGVFIEGEAHTGTFLESLSSTTPPADAALASKMIKDYMVNSRQQELTPGDDRPYFMEVIGGSLVSNIMTASSVSEAALITYQEFRTQRETRFLESDFVDGMFDEYLSVFQ